MPRLRLMALIMLTTPVRLASAPPEAADRASLLRALQQQNAAACAAIASIDQRLYCRVALGQDPALCSGITDLTLRALCRATAKTPLHP